MLHTCEAEEGQCTHACLHSTYVECCIGIFRLMSRACTHAWLWGGRDTSSIRSRPIHGALQGNLKTATCSWMFLRQSANLSAGPEHGTKDAQRLQFNRCTGSAVAYGLPWTVNSQVSSCSPTTCLQKTTQGMRNRFCELSLPLCVEFGYSDGCHNAAVLLLTAARFGPLRD